METNVNGVVLIDVSPGPGADFERSFLEKAGHPVVVCHGPHEGELCPLLAGKGCADFEAAHGIVFQLDLERPQHQAILRRYQALSDEERPIRVVVPAEQVGRFQPLLEGVEVWTEEPTAADLDGFAAQVEATDR